MDGELRIIKVNYLCILVISHHAYVYTFLFPLLSESQWEIVAPSTSDNSRRVNL